MKRCFILLLLVSLSSQAQIDFQQLNIVRQAFSFNSGSAFVPVVITTEIGRRISQNIERTEIIQKEAQKRAQNIQSSIRKSPSLDEIYREHREKIRVLKKQIADKETAQSLNSKDELEDLRSELFELLENPPDFERTETAKKSGLFSESIVSWRPILDSIKNYLVPGMRMAAPKSKEKSGGGDSKPAAPSEAQQQPPQTPAQALPASLQATTSVPGVVGFGLTIQTTSGPIALPIPSELQPIFFTLHNENVALKGENQQLKMRLADTEQRLQRETDRSTAYERDLGHITAQYDEHQSEIERLLAENHDLRHELERLVRENNLLRAENEEMKRDLLDTRVRLKHVETELEDTKSTLTTVKADLSEMRYYLEIGEMFNYANVAVRNAFRLGRFGSVGLVAMARKALSGQMSEEESRIWRAFAEEHPQVNDPDVIDCIDDLSNQRVRRAHPSVRRLNERQFTERLRFVIGEDHPVIQKIVDLIFGFPL